MKVGFTLRVGQSEMLLIVLVISLETVVTVTMTVVMVVGTEVVKVVITVS